MSILRYFKKVSDDTLEIAAAESHLSNNELSSVMKTIGEESCVKAPEKKKRKYVDYDQFRRAEIARWATKNGARAAGRKFGIPESTVRGFVKCYKAAGDVEVLPRIKRGNKLSFTR